MYIKLLILFLIFLSSYENQTINQKTIRKRRLNNQTSNIKSENLTLTETTKNITFPNSINPKYLMIWYENCELNAKYNDNITTGENNYIQITYSNSYDVTINRIDTNNLECIFYYTTYDENGISIDESITYGFGNFEKLNFSFIVENNTNPSYILYFNKLGNGDLTIDLNSNNINEQIIIKNINPFKGIYLNRNNLFQLCSDKESYNCSFNINITGKNIPFNLLILNSHDDPIPSYFPSNKMILGISESFHTLYFYTPIIKGKKGELYINYKRSNTIVYSTIISSDKYNITSNRKNINEFSYDYINRKISFDSSSCESDECRLYIGIYVNSYRVDDVGEFSFFLRYIDDDNNKSIVNLKLNEYVFGNLNNNEIDFYQVNITNDNMKLYIFFDSDLCKLDVNEDISNLEKEYDINGNLYTITNISKTDFPNLTFKISTKYSSSSFYSFKIVLVENNENLIQQINSEIMEFCNITKSNEYCYFAYPLKSYQSSTQLTLYAINEKYPFTFSSSIKIKEINFDNLNSVDLNSGFSGITKNNLLTYNITNEEKDKYILISLKSNVPGKIYLLSNIYPNYEKKILFPNLINVFHFLNNDTNKTEIVLNLNNTNIQFYDFINLNKISYLTFPTEGERYLNTESYEYNIIPNSDKQNIYYYGEGDFLIRNLNFPIKHNLHYLNFDINETLIFKKYDDVSIFPILIYKKFPFDLTSNLSFTFTINENSNYSFIYGYSTEEDLLKFLSGNSNLNITNFTNGEINFNYTFLNGSFQLIESEINNLDNKSYICILINSTDYTKDSINIKLFEKINIIETFNNDSLTVYTSSKNKNNKAKINNNKITGFTLPSKIGFYFYRIYFFLPPYFDIFFHSYNIDNNYLNYNNKQNDTFRSFKANKYGRKNIYIIRNNEDSIGCRLYFFNNRNRRFLSDEEVNSEIEIKYENTENESDLNSYEITSDSLSITTYNNLTKLISANPLIDNNNNTYDNVQYILYFYNNDLSDDDIDKINENENSIKSIEGNINENNNKVELLINNEGIIQNKTLKIMLTASVNNDEKVNYKITTIDMSSEYDNSNNYDLSFNPNNEFIFKKKNKKKKWWIALIVVGVVIIICIVIFILYRKKTIKKDNVEYNKVYSNSKIHFEKETNNNNIDAKIQKSLFKSENK